MNQNKLEKDLKITSTVSPMIVVVGLATAAGAGYLLWANRLKIQRFFKEQDLEKTVAQVTDFVAEGASKMNGILHHEVRPLTGTTNSTMDKLQAAK
jgi:hypothetical protein